MPKGELRGALLAVALISAATAPALAGGLQAPTNHDRPGQATTGDEPETTLEPPGDRVEPGLLDDLDPTANHVIVRFDDRSAMRSALAGTDLDVRYRFESRPAVYAVAPGEAVRSLARSPSVAFVEDALEPIAFDLDTATLATRAREVYDPDADNEHLPGDPPAIEVDGSVVDGSDVGIALIDTGVDANHPDLASEVERSFVATAGGLVEAPYHSVHDPHGTAVAGVAGGTGASTGGALAGAAPGASLYSFAVTHATIEQLYFQEDAATLHPAVAMDWIAEHGDEQDPPIRVVNNAWHCKHRECRATGANQSIHAELTDELVEEGIVVTWAYGNTRFTWNREATNPTPGVVGVSAYNDNNLGIRTACTARGFSAGEPSDPSTWPDVAAPGKSIETTAPVHLGTRTRTPTEATYSRFDGSSLAAGHVAGTAALMLQANPGLDPAEVEWLLEETATELPADRCGVPYNRGDPSHPTSAANHRAGHGLIDAYAAVENATGFDDVPETNATAVEPDEDFLETPDETDTVAVDRRLYLDGDDGLSPGRPGGTDGRSLQKASDESVAFTSAPFDTPTNVTGIDGSVWMRLDSERLVNPWGDFFADIQIRVTVEQVGSGGALKDAVTTTSPFAWNLRSEAVERPFVRVFDDPMAFDVGDRVRVEVAVLEGGVGGSGTETTSWELLWGSALHPSHVGLGQQAPDADGTYRGCREHAGDACAWIDADHPTATTAFDGGRYQLEWEGPGGSGAEMRLHGTLVDGCTVPEDVDWGRCTARMHSAAFGSVGSTTCEIADPAPPNEGHGRCWILEDR